MNSLGGTKSLLIWNCRQHTTCQAVSVILRKVLGRLNGSWIIWYVCRTFCNIMIFVPIFLLCIALIGTAKSLLLSNHLTSSLMIYLFCVCFLLFSFLPLSSHLFPILLFILGSLLPSLSTEHDHGMQVLSPRHRLSKQVNTFT